MGYELGNFSIATMAMKALLRSLPGCLACRNRHKDERVSEVAVPIISMPDKSNSDRIALIGTLAGGAIDRFHSNRAAPVRCQRRQRKRAPVQAWNRLCRPS